MEEINWKEQLRFVDTDERLIWRDTGTILNIGTGSYRVSVRRIRLYSCNQANTS